MNTLVLLTGLVTLGPHIDAAANVECKRDVFRAIKNVFLLRILSPVFVHKLCDSVDCR